MSLCRLRGAFVVMALSTLAGCSELGLAGPDSTTTTYQSVWINASWSGGATGAPNSLVARGPGDLTGSYCPAESLVMDNHGTRYLNFFSHAREVLVIKNACGQSASLLACVSSGSGGNFSEFPVCNQDPRTTPVSRLKVISLGPNNSGIQSATWFETGTNLSLNVFYCGVDDAFALGVVSGANPTDCVQ